MYRGGYSLEKYPTHAFSRLRYGLKYPTDHSSKVRYELDTGGPQFGMFGSSSKQNRQVLNAAHTAATKEKHCPATRGKKRADEISNPPVPRTE